MKVLLISQQSLFILGMRRLLASIKDIEMSTTTEFGESLLFTIENCPPDVAIVDTDGHNEVGLLLVRRVKKSFPKIPVVVCTSDPSDDQLLRALKAQAVAFISKQVSANEFVDVIIRAANGGYPIRESVCSHHNVVEAVLHQFRKLAIRRDTSAYVSPLTQREKEILNYMANGYHNKQIADRLGVKEFTIRNQISSILRKSNSNTRTQAIMKAIKHGLVSVHLSDKTGEYNQILKKRGDFNNKQSVMVKQ